MFWGKAVLNDGKPVALLPLGAHCLDVAAVFRALTNLRIFRERLEAAAGIGLMDQQLDRLAVLSLLHDLGKVNLGFQNKIFSNDAPKIGHISPLAGLFVHFQEQLADALGIETLSNWFDSETTLSSFLVAAWSHHGEPIKIDSCELAGPHTSRRWWEKDGEKDPFAAIEELMVVARQNFPFAFSQNVAAMPGRAAFQHRFAGLVMLADWLGSHQSYFPVSRDNSFDSFEASKKILEAVGLNTSASRRIMSEAPTDFFFRFGFEHMQPLQEAISQTSVHTPESSLLIAEAETGSGKTEAALNRFFDLFSAGKVDALYFALPTRVAARELYERVRGYIERLFPNQLERPAVVLAVPGYALVDGVSPDTLLPDNRTQPFLSIDPWPALSGWAAEHPKRFLAAPIAVGTIDQALLSTLRLKHAHLRSVCLDRSLLVVDEVHASDVYMRQLLKSLLDHHLGLGGHALLLSATLGSVARCEFVAGLQKADVPGFCEAISAAYPAVTDRTGTMRGVVHSENKTSDKRVRIELLPVMERPDKSLPVIAQALKAGCRVLVVLNTVARAVQLLRAAELSEEIRPEMVFRCNGIVAPHHGRFAPRDREVLDGAVSKRLGKGSHAGPLLLIGTQTLEQSLDIDADLLVTDLCPMDVLLQRIGRLHRHHRARPREYETARCLVLAPEERGLQELLTANGIAVKKAKKCGLGSVYEDMRSLELTLELLRSNAEICLPRDNRRLVEGATHPDRIKTLLDSRMQQHGILIEGADIAQKIAAGYAAISDLYDKNFNDFRFKEVDDQRVRTRLGLNSLQLPLDREVKSPFGVMLNEILIPGHLAPSREKKCEQASIVKADDESISLMVGDKRYNYSRFGLELTDGPQ